MAQVRTGEVRQLEPLFEKHHKPLHGFFVRLTGNRALSEDLVQDVFFRILRYRHTYDEKHPFTAWMYQIARNAHVDHMQKRRGETPLPEAVGRDWEEPVSRTPNADELFGRRQEIGLLRKALQALPEDKREVLVLSRYQDLKYEEIARIMGCEVGTVKVRVFRAMRALGEIFHEMAGEKAS